MKREEAAVVARSAEPNDPVQRAITERALLDAGPEHVVSVREVRGGDPRWQGFNVSTGDAIAFAGVPTGVFIYGGDTFKEACEDVERIASKWGWTFRRPEELGL